MQKATVSFTYYSTIFVVLILIYADGALFIDVLFCVGSLRYVTALFMLLTVGS